MPDETPLVKCAECGFLTLRNRFTGELDEMDRDFRETGERPTRKAIGGSPLIQYTSTPTGIIWPYDAVPICFVQAVDLWGELAGTTVTPGSVNLSPDLVKEIIQKERECPPIGKELGWTEWHQGFTPKEHREMLDRQWLLDYQARREDADKTWREGQEEKAAIREQGFELRLTKIVAIVAITAAILGGLASAGFTALVQKNPTVTTGPTNVNVPTQPPVINIVVPTVTLDSR